MAPELLSPSNAMPKFWLPTEDIEHTYQMVKEDRWFEMYQPLLLAMANTKFGRDLLCIPHEYPEIVKMTKCSVHCLNSIDDKGTAIITADFRIGAKWANVIRFRWNQFVSYSRYFDFRINPAPLIYVDQPFSPMTKSVLALRMDSITAYPQPDPETTTFDGYAIHNVAGTSWATLIAAAGNGSGDTDADNLFMEMDSGASNPNWNLCGRSLFLYDTSSIGAGRQVLSAVMSLFGSAKLDSVPNLPDINVFTSTPASNTAVANGDYAQVGSSAQATAIGYNSWSTSAYNDFTFTTLTNISKTGVTKLGTRNANYDAAAVQPTYGTNKNHYMKGKFADNTGTSSDPKLVVTYSQPFYARILINQAVRRSSRY